MNRLAWGFISASVSAHEGTLIYVSANVEALGSGTPEYTRWNVECVFRQECLPNSL